MDTMYSGQTGSPILTLAEDITSTDTTITLNEDVDQLPSAPNLVTIYDGQSYETILYESVDNSNNQLETITRGFEGDASSWDMDTRVTRLLTAYDVDTFKANITENQGNIKSDENIYDAVDTLLTAGSDITLTYDDSEDTLTITVDGSALDADSVDGYNVEVVASEPASPDANTIYFVEE